MKGKKLRVIVCLFLVLVLTGCGGGLFDPEYAIKAPLNGTYQDVFNVVCGAVGKEITLKYPSVKGVNTAYYSWDLDGDGVAETLVFYQPRSKGGATRVHVVKQKNGQWESLQDLEPIGSDILHVDFCDFNGDGTEELCLGWSVATATTNRMSVYQVQSGVLVKRANEEYSQYVVCDIDNDGKKELGLATLLTESQESTLRFYTIQRDAFKEFISIGLDSNVVSYDKITAAPINANTTGVFLDVYKGADSMITELVYYENGKLCNPFGGALDNANVSTLRYCVVSSDDINGDGKIEIPFLRQLPGYYEAEDQNMSHYLLNWQSFDGNLSQPVAMWYYPLSRGYYLTLDPSLQDRFTVVYKEELDADVFYDWNGELAQGELFRLKPFYKEKQKEMDMGEYTKLFENETLIWGVYVPQSDSDALFSYETLKEGFNIIIQ